MIQRQVPTLKTLADDFADTFRPNRRDLPRGRILLSILSIVLLMLVASMYAMTITHFTKREMLGMTSGWWVTTLALELTALGIMFSIDRRRDRFAKESASKMLGTEFATLDDAKRAHLLNALGATPNEFGPIAERIHKHQELGVLVGIRDAGKVGRALKMVYDPDSKPRLLALTVVISAAMTIPFGVRYSDIDAVLEILHSAAYWNAVWFVGILAAIVFVGLNILLWEARFIARGIEAWLMGELTIRYLVRELARLDEPLPSPTTRHELVQTPQPYQHRMAPGRRRLRPENKRFSLKK